MFNIFHLISKRKIKILNSDKFQFFFYLSCEMIFASWTFHGYLLDLTITSHDGDLTNYVKNGEWELVKLIVERKTTVYSCCPEPYPGDTLNII